MEPNYAYGSVYIDEKSIDEARGTEQEHKITVEYKGIKKDFSLDEFLQRLGIKQ